MLWLLAFLPEPAYHAIVVAFLLLTLRLFLPDLLRCADRLVERAACCRTAAADQVFPQKRQQLQNQLQPDPKEEQQLQKQQQQQQPQQQEKIREQFNCSFKCNDADWSVGCVSCDCGCVLTRTEGSAAAPERFRLQELQKISLESWQKGDSKDASLLISLSFQTARLQLLPESPNAAAKWLRLLLLQLLVARPELTAARQRASVQQVAEKLQELCEQEPCAFSLELLAKLLKQFGIFATRGDLKEFLQRQLGKWRPDSFQEMAQAANSVLAEADDTDAFAAYAIAESHGNIMSLVGLHSFLTESQGEALSLLETFRLLRAQATEDLDLTDLLLLSKRNFKSLLDCNVCTTPLRPELLQLRQPLDRPLTDYFVSTSHNTYLMEDQLVGRSDCAAYENALKKNCRCIELDIHNGPNGDPVITHGGTWTSKIRFEDVIKTIRKFAFVASDYPLILSFENHCGIEQQERMAEIISAQMGDCLYSDANAHQLQRMPTPEELKRKIVLKNKKLHAATLHTAASFGSIDEAEEETDSDSDSDQAAAEETAEKIRRVLPPEAAAEVAADANAVAPPPAKQKLKVAQSLSDMVAICRPVKFKGQRYARQHYLPVEMSSLPESKMDKKQWTRKDGESANQFVLHTQYQLVRVYPSGLRPYSSNYNPVIGWRFGCQLVAMNYQTRGENMEINDGLFQLNGSCGYVPKPKLLADTDTQFNPFSPDPALAARLRLEIVSAANLRLPAGASDDKGLSPRVKVTLFGVPGDERKDKTKKADQGFRPRWGHRCFAENSVVRVPQLAHLRMEVKDKISGKPIGQYTAPLTAFCQGYRRVHLKDSMDCSTQSQLWIKFQLSA